MNKIIVISHESCGGGVGMHNGELFSNLDSAREYLKRNGFTDRKSWDMAQTEYGDSTDHVELLEKEINE